MTEHMSLKPKVETESVDTGIASSEQSDLVRHLSYALADSYLLYVQTQGAHWNVVGPAFYSVHKLTEVQYEDLAAAIDTIAERIRALGGVAPSSFGEFTALSTLESEPTTSSAETLIERLVDSNQTIAGRMRTAVEAAGDAGDVFTADLLTARIGAHEEAAWMLRSLIAA